MFKVSVLRPNQAGMAAHGLQIMADIPNSTNVAPQIEGSEVVVGWAAPRKIRCRLW